MIKTIKYSGDNLKGILCFMHSFYSDSEYKSSINVSASSTNTAFSPLNAINFNSNKIWHPGIYGIPGEYLQIEIKSGWIEIEGYSIQTSNLAAGSAHPKIGDSQLRKMGRNGPPVRTTLILIIR